MKTRAEPSRSTHVSTQPTRRARRPFFEKAGDAPGLQTRLKIGRTGDRFEREADAVADAVVGDAPGPERGHAEPLVTRISPFVQPRADASEAADGSPRVDEDEIRTKADDEREEPVQTQVEDEAEEPIQTQAEQEEPVQTQAEDEREEPVQARAATASRPPVPRRFEQRLRASRGRGSPLPDNVRSRMEASFGADFGGVRIHTDDLAAQLARQVRARAFAHGRDIYFNERGISPGTREGEHLLAHELTHTIQQDAVAARDSDAGTDATQPSLAPDAASETPTPTSETSAGDVVPTPPSADAVSTPTATPAPEGTEDADIAVETLEPAAATPPEAVAPVTEPALPDSSEATLIGFIDASPSQMAATQPTLGATLDRTIGQEKTAEANNAPVLSAQTSGVAEAPGTPPDPVPVPGDTTIDDGVAGPDPGRLEAEPHDSVGAPPDNAEGERLLDQTGEGGLLGWLRDNISAFLSSIRTTDPGLDTSAGARPNVKLEGAADPGRMETQRSDGAGKLEAQRDATTDAIRNHPGQQNIQPKQVSEAKSAAPDPETSVRIELPAEQTVADYAAAPLPAEVRNKADTLLRPGLRVNLSETRTTAEQAAADRERDRKAEVDNAEAETARVNQQAERDQRDIVIRSRRDVAQKQKTGIEDARGEVDAFSREAGTAQVAARAQIGDKARDSETRARGELEKGEAEAEKKKVEGEQRADAKKQALERDQASSSWWDRAVSAVKSAVKAITSAIDAIFTTIRNAVKTIIDKARDVAVGLINAARDWIVDKLNKFRDWAKAAVDRYLKERFPALAAAINRGIDTVVNVAIAGVNFVADTAIAAVDALAKALAAVLDKILMVYQTALRTAVQLAGAALTLDFAGALRIAIQAACDVAGIDSKPIFDFIDRAAASAVKILGRPVAFFNNLMAAVGGGVRSFVRNIRKHLVKGLIGWLTGALSEGGITLPSTFDFKGILSLVLQVLGLTYENIKARVIKRFPPAAKVFGLVETGLDVVKRLVTEGPIALWQMIREKLSNLKEVVLGGIRDFVITTVIKEGIVWLLSLLNPAGAIVKVAKLLFDFVMFLVERFQQIKDFVLSVYGSITAIASGALTKAIAAVEDALGRSLPVVISLLASLAGLGGIGKTITKIIGKVTKPINKAIDAVIDRIIAFAKKLLKKGKAAAGKVKEKLAQWWKVKKSFRTKTGEDHSLFFEESGASATLMLKSTPRSYTSFISKIPVNGDEQKAAKTRATKIAKQIESLKKSRGMTKTKDGVKDQTPEFERLLGQLARETAIFMVRDDAEVPVSTPPAYGSLRNGFATSMRINILSRLGPPGTPVRASHPTMDTLKQRLEVTRTYYIAGHLLNNNLHGPGTTWKNLTPITQQANRRHLDRVESKIKRGVDDDRIYRYEIQVNYGRSFNQGLLNHFTNLASSDPLWKKRAAVVKAEQHLPTSLAASWQELDRSGAPKGSESQARIDNKIDERPESYNVRS